VDELYELLIELTPQHLAGERPTVRDWNKAMGVARAVLELHKPTEALGFGELCEACSIDSIDFPLFVSYPCNTVRAIARALDVPIGDQQ
jgi:hypothetical protein